MAKIRYFVWSRLRLAEQSENPILVVFIIEKTSILFKWFSRCLTFC